MIEEGIRFWGFEYVDVNRDMYIQISGFYICGCIQRYVYIDFRVLYMWMYIEIEKK